MTTVSKGKGILAPRRGKGGRVVASQCAMNSFFSGIGGFDLAFERRGFKASFFCENNSLCRSILSRHWPSVPIASDIELLRTTDIPDATLWTAGFPCQDLSIARTPHGRRGLKGHNSGLFFTFRELLARKKPEVVLLENVAGLLNSHKGADFKVLVSSLSQLGYAVAWRILNARYFGVPQSRPRIFICAWQDSPERAAAALYDDVLTIAPRNQRAGFLEEHKCEITGARVPAVSFCISATSGRHTGLDWARSYVTYPNRVRRLTPLECERLQGFPDHWAQPASDFVAPIRGFETERYQAIGNAVCVPVAEWIAAKVAKLLNGNATAPLSQSTERRIRTAAPEFQSFGADTDFLNDVSRWKSGGCAFRGNVVQNSVSCAPAEVSLSLFVSILEKGAINSKYFLSPNAALGIVKRVEKMGRQLFSPLDKELRNLANEVRIKYSDDQRLAATA